MDNNVTKRIVDGLALYYYESCPYCRRVLRTMDELGVTFELRDITQFANHLQDLTRARGARTVPVLRIHKDGTEGGDEWMPESADIMRYLEQRFG